MHMSQQTEIGIGAIAYEIPAGRIENLDRIDQLGATEELLHEKIGVLRVSRKADGQETSDLCVTAIRRLFDTGAVTPEEVDCLVVVTQNPDGYGLPHTSARVHGMLGLPTACAVFDLSLGCSGFVYALSVVGSFMQAQGLRRGVLVTADPYSKIVNMDDKNTSLLFGDAAAATLLTDAPQWRIGKFDLGSDGSICEELAVIDETRHLYMNGRAVLNFSAKQVPVSIHKALELNQVKLEDVDRFLLHQGSRHIVTKLAERLGIDQDKAPFLAEDYGNTVSSSIPIMLAQDAVKDESIVVISGFGVGLSWGTTVLFRTS